MALTLYRITATNKLVVVDSATPPSGGVAVTLSPTGNLVDTAPWTRTLDAATSHAADWHPAEYPPLTPELIASEIGIVADLSNDNHTVPTDSSGSNGNFTGCATTMSVYMGSVDDSANWTYAVTKSTGVTCTETVTDRTQTVTAMTVDTGTVTIVASKNGYASLTQVFSISKAKSGVAYRINLSDNSVRKSSLGVLSPLSLTLTASKIDVSGVTAYTGRFKIYLNGSATATYTSAADEASKVYTVTAADATIKCELYLAGGATTLVDTETVLVVADGVDGTDGVDGADGNNGSNGTRGSGEFYAVGSSWIDSTAANAVYAVYPLLTYPAGLVYGDTVTISNNSTYVLTKYWNGSTWTDLGTVIDGSLIVTNSITAAKINSNGLSIKDAYGNIILAAGSALDFSNVGGSTKPANNATVGATFGTNISGQITAATASTYIASLAVDTLQLKDNAITSAWTDNMAVKQALSTAGTWVTKTFTSFTVPVAGKLVVIIHSTYHNFGTASNLRMQCIHFVNGSASTVEYPSFFLNAAAVNASLSPLGGISTAGTSATHTSSEELIVTAGQTITVEITAWAASANSTLYLLDGWFVASLYKK